MPHLLLVPRRAGQPGSHRGGSNSASSLLSTLIPVFVVAVIAIAAFLFLRRKYQKVYRPRSEKTILHEDVRQTPQSSKGFFATLADAHNLPDSFVLEHNSLDGYLFLRFFKVLVIISLVGVCITWPILFPVNATGGGGESQLDILSFSNVADVKRYYAHALVAWVFLGFVLLLVTRERMVFIGLRQAYFLNSVRAKRLTSRTVLFMGLPDDKKSVPALRSMFGPDVHKIWLGTDCEELEDMVQDRDQAAVKLEGAEVQLSKKANKSRLEAEKKETHKETGSNRRDPNSWFEDKERPTHRLKPIVGDKVDTINWARKEIPTLNHKIAREQPRHRGSDATIMSAAFVEFTSQAAAQRAFQLGGGKSKKHFQPRYIDVQPDEIIWKNLGHSWAQRKIKITVATALISLIIILWTPIVAFVGALTNIDYLTDLVPFLSFINNIPSVILGVVTGLLPTIILVICVLLVPIICRFLAKLAGEPTLSQIELRTQSWYFAFQVIQVFLMTTFTSGATAVTTQIIQDPTSAPQLLAKNLPKASNFYLSYFVLYGLAQAAFQLLSVVPLLLYVVLGSVLDKTPRKMYNRWMKLAGLGWGSEYPKWTNLGVIAISYSCIAPLVLGFAAIGFSLLYLAFRYKWLFILGNQIDMKGEAYSKALQQLTVGVYLSTVCLIGLFAIGTSGNAAGTGPLVLMIIFLLVAIVFHVVTNYALGPLEEGLPLELVSSHDYSRRSNEVKLGDVERHGTDPRSSSPSHNSGISVKADVEANSSSTEHTGNKLTQRLRPYIDSRFYAPNKSKTFELPAVDYDYEDAFYNPSITAEEPYLWLARDGCGVSEMLIRGNNDAGIRSTNEHAWFDEKNKLHWSVDDAAKVTAMLEEKEEKREKNQEEKEEGEKSQGQVQAGQAQIHDQR